MITTGKVSLSLAGHCYNQIFVVKYLNIKEKMEIFHSESLIALIKSVGYIGIFAIIFAESGVMRTQVEEMSSMFLSFAFPEENVPSN